MNRKKKNIDVLNVIIIFLYIFNPCFFSVTQQLIIQGIFIIYSIIFLFINKKININRRVIKIIIGFIPFLGYLFINLAFRAFYDNKITVDACFSELLICYSIFFRTIVICYGLYAFFKRRKKDIDRFMIDLVFVGIVQLFFVIITLCFPNIRDIFNSMTINKSTLTNVVEYTINVKQRCYGLAENLFDSFGYLTSFLIIIPFIYGVNRSNIKYIILSIVMLIMPTLNSRTGIVLVISSYIITFIYLGNKIRFKTILKCSLVVVIVIFAGIGLIKVLPQDTTKWVLEGVNDIKLLLLNNEKTGFFNAITSNVIYPNNWLFGDGGSPDRLGIGHNDIGYIQCLWRYGIVGTCLLLGGYINAFMNAYLHIKKINREYACYIINCMFIFFIYLYKLYSFGNLGAQFIIFMIVIMAVTENRKKE